MISIVNILESLEATTKRLEKEEILKKVINDDLLKRFFFNALDPYTNFGVSKVKVVVSNSEYNLEISNKQIESFIDLLEHELAPRKLTGNLAKEKVIYHLSQMDVLTYKWCMRLLLRNLRCGVQITTINKLIPKFIQEFDVQLASVPDYVCDNNSIRINEKLFFPIVGEPKLDGLRLVVIKHLGNVTMFTRNGTQLDTLPILKKYFESRQDIQEMVFDGEGTVQNIQGKQSEEVWNDTISVAMAKVNNKSDDNFVYNIFDCLTFDEWTNQTCNKTLLERRNIIENLFKFESNPICLTKFVTCNSIDDILTFYSTCLNEGYEGVMLKELNGKYTFDRSKTWMKLKPITTYEGVIVNTYDGNIGAKREGKFGGFVVLLSNGVTTEVGSGMSDSFKEEVNLNREFYIEKIIECSAQPPLSIDGKMRFPRFKRFREINDVDSKIIEAYENWKLIH